MRRVARIALAVFMVAIGTAHFLVPRPFATIVPPALPARETLVLVSGFFEILGGIGLLIPRVRRAASYGLAALYVAVFPANVYMAISGVQPVHGVHVSAAAAWARLPLQIGFILLALWVGRSDAIEGERPA